MNVTEKILLKHIVNRTKTDIPKEGEKIAIKIDQTLTQDATGTLTYLEFEAMMKEKVKTELSVSYIDHNTLQIGFENADDHSFLKTTAAKYGIIFSPPGNGICHQLHLENFALPGKTLIGSDSHTPTAGAVGMLAIGAGGLDVAAAMAGEPFYLEMPAIINIKLERKLPAWSSAKDIILYLLKRFTVKGGVKKIFEYSGSGLNYLTVPERATIANMGAELGLTSSIFPSDEITLDFLAKTSRKKFWKKLIADADSKYSDVFTVDLSQIEPLIADSPDPDNVKSVKELEGTAINQVCIGSCTNSSFRDLAVAAEILRKYGISQDVDLIISPGSRQVVSALEKIGALGALISAGARIIENACGPCIGMGCAPASRGISIRTFNRNFPGRSGTKDDRVLLSSVEVAAASAVYGKITDPRKSGKYPKVRQIKAYPKAKFILPPRSQKSRDKIQIVRGPNIKPLPEFKKPGEDFSLSVIIKLPDNVSTDDILPAGAKILPLRSNIPAISEFTFNRISPGFAKKAKENTGDLIIVAGENYGQGSSREHAAIVLRYLGIRAVLAKSFARIHYANLINFGIIPLTFEKSSDYDSIETGSKLEKSGTKSFQDIIGEGNKFILRDLTRGKEISVFLSLDERQRQIILSGSFLNYVRGK